MMKLRTVAPVQAPISRIRLDLKQRDHKDGAVWNAQKPVKVVVVEEGDERYILRTFADGEEKREPIIKLPRKRRYPPRPYWHWDFNKERKKGF